MLLREGDDPLENRDLDVELRGYAVSACEDLVAFFIEYALDLGEVRTLGDGCDNIACIVEDRKPGSKTVFSAPDVIGASLMLLELIDDIGTRSVIAYYGHECRP